MVSKERPQERREENEERKRREEEDEKETREPRFSNPEAAINYFEDKGYSFGIVYYPDGVYYVSFRLSDIPRDTTWSQIWVRQSWHDSSGEPLEGAMVYEDKVLKRIVERLWEMSDSGEYNSEEDWSSPIPELENLPLQAKEEILSGIPQKDRSAPLALLVCLALICPRCHGLVPSFMRVCPHCMYEFVTR